MSIAEKLTTIAENEQKVYEAGQKSEYDRFWDKHQQNGERNIYAGAFAGWDGKNFNPKYKIAPAGSTVAHYMFHSFNRQNAEMFDMSPYQHLLDFSGIKAQNGMFYDAFVKNLYCDFSSCTNLASVFQTSNSSKIENITLKVTSKCKVFSSGFANQTDITKLFFTDDSEIVASVSFANSSKLTDESIQSIINALGTVTTTQKITFHSSVVDRLTSEQLLQIANKNWQVG